MHVHVYYTSGHFPDLASLGEHGNDVLTSAPASCKFSDLQDRYGTLDPTAAFACTQGCLAGWAYGSTAIS